MDEYNKYLEDLYKFNTNVYTNDWCGTKTVTVTLRIAKADWDKRRKAGQLGTLYALDLSNYLSRTGQLDFYAAPIVNDKSRAKNGVKIIRIEFRQERRFA